MNAIAGDLELRRALGAIIDAIAALREPDAQPALPHLRALAVLLEGRGLAVQAGDVHQTITRLVNKATQPDLAYESLMHLGHCLRRTGEFEWAAQAFGNAAVLATRERDTERVAAARKARAEVRLLPGASQATSSFA